MSGPYDDILDLPHHTSPTHPPMARSDRAAQFSPFAALTGYDDAISESGRLTQAKIELDEDEKASLDRRLRLSLGEADDPPEVSVTHFIRDSRKEGGAYVTTRGRVKKYDEVQRLITMQDGTSFYLDDILSAEVDGYEEHGS